MTTETRNAVKELREIIGDNPEIIKTIDEIEELLFKGGTVMLADTIRAMANSHQNTIDEIKKEIVDGFRKYCESVEMEKCVKRNISDFDIERGSFWIATYYHRSDRFYGRPTQFIVGGNWSGKGGYMWENPESSKENGYTSLYRGVDLSHKEVWEPICMRLNRELRDYLMEQGFSVSGIYTRSDDRGESFYTTVTL